MNYKLVICLLTLSLFIFSTSTLAHEVEEEHEENGIPEWVGHSILGIASLILGFTTLITGGMLSGRFKRSEKMEVFNVHKLLTISLSILIIATFFYGIWITSGHGAKILASTHGIVGAILAVIAGLSLISSPCLHKRRENHKIHHIFGYILLILLIVQSILGIQNVITY